MIETTATATEVKNNFGKYLEMIMRGKEVIITKNGKEVGRLIPRSHAVSYLTDSLKGIAKGDYDPGEEREKTLKAKYALSD